MAGLVLAVRTDGSLLGVFYHSWCPSGALGGRLEAERKFKGMLYFDDGAN